MSWWTHAVIYQVAARSFQDSDGDGVGDLGGLLRRLDHILGLGVDAVWLCPVQPTPARDFGYDIADLTAVDPCMGTFEQFDEIVRRLHAAGCKLVLDFVPNHTSEAHPWFRESRRSRTEPKADWYVWADPGAGGGPPNNWLSRFGGSAWTFDPGRGQYYYHAFLAEQPDLNWRNPAVREGMFAAMRFWLDRGVDGFRIDAAGVLFEDELLRDDPPRPDADERPPPQRLRRVFTDDRPEALGVFEEMRALVDSYGDRVLLAEVDVEARDPGRFYAGEQPRFHLPLNYTLGGTAFEAVELAAALDAYLRSVPEGGVPNWAFGGHDKKRQASRLGEDAARALAVLHYALPGTVLLFAGDEIGAVAAEIPPDRVRDPFPKLVPGWDLGRDPVRAPFRWDGSAKGGFTTGSPWLPLPPPTPNLADQANDASSTLALHRRLIALRQEAAALRDGAYDPERPRDDVLAFVRAAQDQRLRVLINTARQWRIAPLAEPGRLSLSSRLDREDEACAGEVRLRPHEAVVITSWGPRGRRPPP